MTTDEQTAEATKECPECGEAMNPVPEVFAVLLKFNGIEDAWQCPACGCQPFYGGPAKKAKS